MRVLLVDDEAVFAETLAERLGLRGITAEVAPEGETALAMLKNGDWDLIFLDVGLPGMDGVALLKILRERHPDLDVVMLSGAADIGKAVQAMRRGAVNWLSKPVSVESVLAECRKAGERPRNADVPPGWPRPRAGAVWAGWPRAWRMRSTIP